MAKGCGMIAPNMATMLAFLTTDATCRGETAAHPRAMLRPHLQHAERRWRDLDQRHGPAVRFRPARPPDLDDSPMPSHASAKI
jgi:hypothetical protein